MYMDGQYLRQRTRTRECNASKQITCEGFNRLIDYANEFYT